MPELPEVETMRRGIAPVVGCRIERVEFPQGRRLRPVNLTPGKSTFRKRLQGATIQGLGRLGKRVILELGAHRLVFEPRMTGLVSLTDPPTEEHVRLRLRFAAGSPVPELFFWDRRGLGTLSALTPEAFAERWGPHKLGPDALELTPALMRERLGSSRRPIKVGLLDQKAIAGIGNIYASEALHASKIHPARPCTSIRDAEWRRLQKAVDRILRDSIRHEGSTLSDGTYRNALNAEGSYQNRFRVYDRAGERCKRCRSKGTVERIVQAQRATFFCSSCQEE